MDFTFLPPEVNSARMYAGPGSGSLLAAAGSWDSLAAELDTTAQTYESVLSGLTTFQWRGPASEAMAATAAHYMGWLQTTAAQTKQTAMQARAAAAAYAQAHAMTVPPPALTANRAQLHGLIATNFFGQNTAAIAATEAQYAEYWAQDAAAMSGYAASSAAAAQLTPFSSPQQTTNAAGLTAQNAAVTQANASAAASSPVSQVVAALSQAAQAVPAQLLPIFPGGVIPDLNFTLLNAIQATATAISSTYFLEATPAGIFASEKLLGIPLPAVAPAAGAVAPAAGLRGAASSLGGGAGLGNVTATLARAGTIGPMSVPASWSAPSSSHVAALAPAGLTTLPGTDETVASGYPGYPGMPAGTGSRVPGGPPRYGVRLTVMPRPPAAG